LPTDPADSLQPVRHGPARARSGDPLRDNFFQLFLRSYRSAEKSGRGLEVYRACAAHVYRLCGEGWARATIFPGETALLRRFVAQTGLQLRDPGALAQLSLMANPWAATWTEVLEGLESREFATVCSVSGEEILRAALAAGRGAVCAHYHTLFAPLLWTWMKHNGIPVGVTIREWVKARPAAAQDPRARALEGARELKTAVMALRAGGLMHIVADGYEGSRKVVRPFCNRQRGFETTFIDMALATGAPILTVASRFSGDGSINIEFGPPLRDEPSLAPAARTEALLGQYVAFLRRQWQEHPADVSWFQMRRHLALPPLA
jgi:lauroyl/myristoyl acyltransferase